MNPTSRSCKPTSSNTGPTVLVEPPKKGFDLLAWIMPIAVPMMAFVLVWDVVRSWRKKAHSRPPAVRTVDAEFLARAQREAAGKGVNR